MAEVQLNVKLIAHTQLSKEFLDEVFDAEMMSRIVNENWDVTGSKAVALTAIRTCYSPNKPTEIIAKEGEKYFGREASDGEEGTEADRLIRHIMKSRHLSTMEHLNYTFAVEGLSRSALAQLTRHRFFSFSVQSQRYVKFGSDDKSRGFDFVKPRSTSVPGTVDGWEAWEIYDNAMRMAQKAYDMLRELGVPAEDARFVLPNAAATNLVMTGNLRAILDFYSKRKLGRGAQWEAAELAERIREEVVKVDPWTDAFFEEV